MSNAPSPPSQDSCELPMDPDRHIEEAKEIFREARGDEANVGKSRLAGAPRNELEACIKSSFQKLASLVAGRSDLALPGPEYLMSFYVLLVQNQQSDKLSNDEDYAIRELINYIYAEVEKADKMNYVARSVIQARETDYVGRNQTLVDV